MADPPLVSIVVPAFNAEATLAETLASALAQTYRNVEILLVDDGSTDGTAEIAQAFAARSPALTIIRTANRGVAAARNTAIARARGAWIAPLDADDLWHPEKIARQVAVASASPHRPAFVYCRVRLIDMAGLVIGEQGAVDARGRVFHQLLYRNFVGCGGSALIRRDSILDVGGYDEASKGGEDVLLQLHMARRHAFDLAPAWLVGYRATPGSMTADSAQVWRSWERIEAEAASLYPNAPPRLARWRRARVAAQRGAGDVLAGRRIAGLAWLARALLGDPLWTSAWLLARLRRRKAAEGLPFAQADPDAAGPAPSRLPLHLRLEKRRLRRLAALDEAEAA